MATTRLMPIHAGKGRTVGKAIQKVIAYVKNPEKTDSGQLITTFECDSYTADAEFLLAKREYLQRTGRERGKDDVIAYHLRQSFVPGEITPEEANRLGYELAKRFTKGEHAFIVCTHIDKHHCHNHIIFNSTSLDYTRKFRDFRGSGRALGRLSDKICLENGYSIIEEPGGKGDTYDKWLGDRRKPSFREQICKSIDGALSQNPKSFSELMDTLRRAGYEIRDRDGAIRGRGQKRFIRMDTLGEGYSIEVLTAVIAGNRQHKPRKYRQYSDEKTIAPNLLIDIQKILAEGKGAGYAQWAKRFNRDELAKTMAYLKEHGLLDYAVLKEKTESVTQRYHELSDQIKIIKARMREISDLRTQIINYHKTRDVYVAYRKAGYSKQFLAEHESDIIIHKAAKKYFDEVGLTKLPTLKSLTAEFEDLRVKKNRAYTEYHQARADMKELQIAKSNIDTLMGTGGTDHEKKRQTQKY